MNKIVVMCAGSPGKSIPLHLLEEIAPVVIIGPDTGTHAPSLEDRRRDITYEIKNYHEPDAQQYEIVKKENPYKNGQLRKKGKGGYRKY